MKKKHREAMIAMGIKIAGLEEIVHRHTLVFGAQRTRLSELDEELDCLKHGANPAGQDLLQRVNESEHSIHSLECERGRHEHSIQMLSKQLSALEKVKDALYETSNAQALAIDVIKHQIKEINSRPLYGVEVLNEDEILERIRYWKGESSNEDSPGKIEYYRDLLRQLRIKKSSEGEYKRIMKHGASVG